MAAPGSLYLAAHGVPVVPSALVTSPRTGGIELLVGIVTDPAWGQVLAVGLGGIWIEILRDTSLSVLPASHDQIVASLRRLQKEKST